MSIRILTQQGKTYAGTTVAAVVTTVTAVVAAIASVVTTVATVATVAIAAATRVNGNASRLADGGSVGKDLGDTVSVADGLGAVTEAVDEVVFLAQAGQVLVTTLELLGLRGSVHVVGAGLLDKC